MTRTLEGTWEEIVAHAAEFNGKRVKITVFEPFPVRPEHAGKTLAELFEGRVGVVDNLPPDLAERSEEYFAQIMAEKFPQDAK